MPPNSVDCCVCDPPYGLSEHRSADIAKCLTTWLRGDTYDHHRAGYMAKMWDNFVPSPPIWQQVLRVLKPGGILLTFAGTRTVDLMGVSVRLAGFQVRDVITFAWFYGDGFTKNNFLDRKIAPTNPRVASHFHGYGTHLKPAFEPIILARKPPVGTAVASTIKWETGGINVDGCRVPYPTPDDVPNEGFTSGVASLHADQVTYGVSAINYSANKPKPRYTPHAAGRFPTNVVCGTTGGSTGLERFFFHCKIRRTERDGSLHPTIKPIALMEYLVKLVAPPNSASVVLDPFAGTGSTGAAAVRLGYRTILVEREESYLGSIERKLAKAHAWREKHT